MTWVFKTVSTSLGFDVQGVGGVRLQTRLQLHTPPHSAFSYNLYTLPQVTLTGQNLLQQWLNETNIICLPLSAVHSFSFSPPLKSVFEPFDYFR